MLSTQLAFPWRIWIFATRETLRADVRLAAPSGKRREGREYVTTVGQFEPASFARDLKDRKGCGGATPEQTDEDSASDGCRVREVGLGEVKLLSGGEKIRPTLESNGVPGVFFDSWWSKVSRDKEGKRTPVSRTTASLRPQAVKMVLYARVVALRTEAKE